jgi:adenine-specific DNA-methyltransferase
MRPSLLTKLSKLIERKSKYIIEGKLNKNLLAADARKYEQELLNTLQKDPEVKEHFFIETDGGLVFKKDVFLQFISNKEFLPDSFTKYKIKIGLGGSDGSLLQESGNIVLNWPYKDTILEGGMEKEDQKSRQEVFFNETLAPDQVTRLLDDKVYTNWKRYDSGGERPLDRLTDDDNLIIKGNNLIVLHSLKKRFTGKVKMIYNRDDDKTTFYNDKFNHSTWLTFMKNRLEVAKQLLSADGIIFISIDDNEAAYLKVLGDEIFGRENFLSTIAYERSGVSGLGQGGDFLVNTHESIICFAKSKAQMKVYDLSGDATFSQKEMKRYNKILVNVDEGEKIHSFIAPSTKEEVVIKRHSDYKISTISLRDYDKNIDVILGQYINNFDKVFRNTSVQEENQFQNKILQFAKDGLYSATYLVSRGKNKGQVITAYYLNGQVFAWLKDSAKCEEGRIVKTNKLSDFWDHASIPKADLANEGGVKLRRGKKPENLIKRLINIATRPGDIVLDYHLGSGTTTAVAHKMGRQYIGVEQLDYGDNDPTVRLKNVIDGDQSGISKGVGWAGGGSFVYASIMNNANTFRERVEKAKNDADHVELLDEATTSSFLSYRVDSAKLSETEFRRLSSAEKRQTLLELIDNNTLYVNYEDINDPIFEVGAEDKKFSEVLYKKTDE